MKNRYVFLRVLLVLTMIRKGKVSLRKLANVITCFASHALRRTRTGRAPLIVNFELSNECNMNCLFCRSPGGDIYDYNREGGGGFIPKGEMPYGIYTGIIDELKDDLLIAVLYIGGEPLLSKDIYRAIRYATDRRLATMIASNGMLLTPENSRKLLDAGLDFIKVAISGFSQPVYQRQHRHGDIEKIKERLRSLARLNRDGRHGLVIMLDYISYRYNEHEKEQARAFCEELGIIFNVRPGIITGLEDVEPAPPPVQLPVKALCAWPWKVLAVNWNGDLFPCCDCITWSGSTPYARYEPAGPVRIRDLWNGPLLERYRRAHREQGRGFASVCANCTRTGTAFKN